MVTKNMSMLFIYSSRRRITLGCLFILFFFKLDAQTVDSFDIYIKKKLDTLKLDDTIALSMYFNILDKKDVHLPLDEQLRLYHRGLSAAEKIKSTEYSIKFLLEIGYTHCLLEDYDKAIEYAHQNLKKAGENELFKSKIHFQLGLIYIYINDFKFTIKHLNLSLKAAEKVDDPSLLIYPISNLAYTYQILEDYESAIEYHKKSLSQINRFESPDKEHYLGFTYESMSDLYHELEISDSSDYYFKLAYNVLPVIDTIIQFPFTLITGNILMVAASKALDTLDFKSYENIKKRIKPYHDRGNEMTRISLNIKEAIAYNRHQEVEAWVSQTKIDSSYAYVVEEIYLKLIDYYDNLGKYKEKADIEHKLRIFEKKTFKKSKTNYATYAKMKTEAELQKESLKQLRIIDQQKNNILILISILLIVASLFSLIIFYQNRKIVDKNNKLKKDKLIIQKQSSKINQIIQHKEQLFASISYEIWNPLTLLKGVLETVLENPFLAKKDKKLLEIAINNNNRLIGYANQISTLVNAESFNIKPQITTFDLAKLWKKLLNSFRVLATSHQVRLVTTGIFDKISLNTDYNKLLLILKNLLDNALRYNKGNSKIQITQTNSNGTLQIFIHTMVNVDHKHILNVLNEQYEIPFNNNISEIGFDIGLAICKKHIETLKGAIEIKGNLEEGIIFIISLPKMIDVVGKENELLKQKKYEQINITEIPENKPYILIIEVNKEICVLLNTMLNYNYNLVFAHNADDAFKIIDRKMPSLVITDLITPDLNDFEMITILKSEIKYMVIPVLILTARKLDSDKLKAKQIGVDGYIIKPFSKEIITANIDHLLKQFKYRQNTNQKLQITEKVEEEVISAKERNDNEWLEQFDTFIYAQIADFQLNLDTIADEMAVSTTHLHRKIKVLKGMTPMQYVKEIRFKEGKRLLEEQRHYSVKAVSYSVGFKSEKHFSRKFKERFGKYPSEYFKKK